MQSNGVIGLLEIIGLVLWDFRVNFWRELMRQFVDVCLILRWRNKGEGDVR